MRSYSHLGHDKSAEEVVTVLFKKMQTLLNALTRLIKAVTMNILINHRLFCEKNSPSNQNFLVEVVE